MELTAQEIAWLDQEDRHTAEIIRTYGVYLQFVGGDPGHRLTSFAYTVGLFGMGHPEPGYTLPAWIQPRPGEFRA